MDKLAFQLKSCRLYHEDSATLLVKTVLASSVKGRVNRTFSPTAVRRLCHADEA